MQNCVISRSLNKDKTTVGLSAPVLDSCLEAIVGTSKKKKNKTTIHTLPTHILKRKSDFWRGTGPDWGEVVLTGRDSYPCKFISSRYEQDWQTTVFRTRWLAKMISVISPSSATLLFFFFSFTRQQVNEKVLISSLYNWKSGRYHFLELSMIMETRACSRSP